MLVVRLPIDPQKGYFHHCLSLRDPSSTSSSILLLPSHPPRAKYGRFDHSGPVLEGGPVHSLAQITLCQGDSGYCCLSRLSHSWPPNGRGLRQGTPICFLILEVLSFTGGECQSVFWFTKIFSPLAVRLKLPPAYRRINSIFHVSKLKPVFHSHINPPATVFHIKIHEKSWSNPEK